MEDYFNHACKNCPYLDDKETIRRNSQLDIIYCEKCQILIEYQIYRNKSWRIKYVL